MSDALLRAPREDADLINTIALRRCDDERHVIRFQQDGALRSWTLAELDRKAARVAVRLQALGVRPREWASCPATASSSCCWISPS